MKNHSPNLGLRDTCSFCGAYCKPITMDIDCTTVKCGNPACNNCFDGASAAKELQIYNTIKELGHE